jgi:hypothetical protein
MPNKIFLIGLFARKNKILAELEYIKNKFNIKFEDIFVYEVENDDNEYLITFKSKDKNDVNELKSSVVFHVKNKCLFSINALNKLISENSKDANIPNKEIKINWDKYENKLMVVDKEELSVRKLTKLDNKCLLLSD